MRLIFSISSSKGIGTAYSYIFQFGTLSSVFCPLLKLRHKTELHIHKVLILLK